ncbi:hypothetical protein Scep_014574 [Stephania cephalantha]|uniref:Flavin-containing monooxygenase n=1 Tax=Stephania cephalantha TaxID=152367 RepID=A0AAP0J1K4_9MAGN
MEHQMAEMVEGHRRALKDMSATRECRITEENRRALDELESLKQDLYFFLRNAHQTLIRKKVAIFGAGVSGLVAYKYISDKCVRPIVFESQCEVGGVWTHIAQTINSSDPKKPLTDSQTSLGLVQFITHSHITL